MPTKDGLTAYSLVDQKTKDIVRLQPENILGRESGLKTDTMSRRHCQIVTKENRWFLADLDSTNGTFLNGKKMKSREWYAMKVGDEIEFGSIVFTFTGPRAKNEANIEAPRADTVSRVKPRDGEATSRNKIAPSVPAPTIEVPPAEESSEAAPSAGFGLRFLAYFLDFVLSSIIGFAISLPFDKRSPLTVFIPLVVLVLVYLIPMCVRSQTLGKMALNLRVIGPNGLPLTVARVLLRELLGKFGALLVPVAIGGVISGLSNSLAGVVVILGLYTGLFMLYRRNGETFYDLWFGTRVVKGQDV